MAEADLPAETAAAGTADDAELVDAGALKPPHFSSNTPFADMLTHINGKLRIKSPG